MSMLFYRDCDILKHMGGGGGGGGGLEGGGGVLKLCNGSEKQFSR